jgi:hypothetical protein
MTRYSAKEAVATHCMMDLAEMNEYRYQPTLWSMPVWDFGGKHLYTARRIGSKKKPVHRYDDFSPSGYEWKVVFTWNTSEVLEGTDVEEDAA